MPTTSNFGWTTPADTDLVKDGALAIRTLGNGIDTSMAQLKGGTTGQILSKTNGTDMAFTWINNDQGDITAVTAGTGISGGGTTGAVTITNSMATEITASGDIIIGTGSGTFDNLPIGTTGQVLTADTAVSPYKVKWATPSQTFVGCSVWRNATSAWTQNVQATIAYDNEDIDTDGFHSNTTNNSRITIPTGKGGKYAVTAMTIGPDDWNGYGYTYLFKNGSALSAIGLYNDGRFGSQVETSGVNQLIGSTILDLAAGDYLELRIQSAWTTANHQLFSRFTVAYLGA